MNPADGAAKIAMLKDSMRCLTFGLFGLVPVIGLPFAILSLWVGWMVARQEEEFWNAAKPLRIWGILCGWVGVIISMLIAGLVIHNLTIYNSVMGSWNND
jgi:uncharacterized protein YacL